MKLLGHDSAGSELKDGEACVGTQVSGDVGESLGFKDLK